MGVKYFAVDPGRLTIMIADDDVVALATAADALADAGFKVVKATNGQYALQEAIKRRVDLIIMDVSMPQVSGVEACHCLKAMPKTAKIPVVLTAAKKDPAAKTLGERMHGSVRVLRKPFTGADIVSIVKELARPKSFISL